MPVKLQASFWAAALIAAFTCSSFKAQSQLSHLHMHTHERCVVVGLGNNVH